MSCLKRSAYLVALALLALAQEGCADIGLEVRSRDAMLLLTPAADGGTDLNGTVTLTFTTTDATEIWLHTGRIADESFYDVAVIDALAQGHPFPLSLDSDESRELSVAFRAHSFESSLDVAGLVLDLEFYNAESDSFWRVIDYDVTRATPP